MIMLNVYFKGPRLGLLTAKYFSWFSRFHEKPNYSRECFFQTTILVLCPFKFMFSFLVSLQVVEPVTSERAIVAMEKFLFWMEGFHVAHNHTLVGGFLKTAIVAIKKNLLGFRIFCGTLVMLDVNSTLDATYSFNLAPSVLCGDVTFGRIFVVRFEITLTTVETLLVEMYSICVICHRLDCRGLELTYIASNYL